MISEIPKSPLVPRPNSIGGRAPPRRQCATSFNTRIVFVLSVVSNQAYTFLLDHLGIFILDSHHYASSL